MHFTYAGPAEFVSDELRQGDLIRRTEAVDQVLAEIHPHYYRQADYRFLTVLTQSCDLVLRNGACKARYITLAAVRPLQTALDREIENVRRSDVERHVNIADLSRRSSIVQFVERVLNNNEPGYFYLHPELDVGLTEPHCAFLRLSVALRAREHYEKILTAKFGQLTAEFQAKLGWLIGNLYSRVGTADWLDVETEQEFDRRVALLVDATTTWVERRIHAKLVKNYAGASMPISVDDVRAKMEELRPPSRRQVAMERLTALLPALGVDTSGVDKAVRRLISDPEFSQVIRD